MSALNAAKKIVLKVNYICGIIKTITVSISFSSNRTDNKYDHYTVYEYAC